MSNAYDFDVIRIVGDEHLGAYEVTDAMKQSGWVGGTWIRIQQIRSWKEGESIRWKRYVETAGPEDPVLFILRASYEGTDRYTAKYPQRTGEVTCCDYGQFLFKYYETVDLAERTNPGTGSALTYTLNSNLYVSNRGLLTSEAETGATARGVGLCIGLPADNNSYLGCEVLIGPW
jgi:hypothetical protein